MSNALYKELTRSYVPGSPGVTGHPGQPARPGRWETTLIQVCNFGSDRSSTDITGPFYKFTCYMERVTYWVPAQPYIAPTQPVTAVPSQTLIDYQLGWNASARSLLSFPGDGRITFRMPPSPIGAFVGLNDDDLGTGYTELDHAFYASHGIARIYESGVLKYTVGSYSAHDDFMIRRQAGVVTYHVADSLIYTSETESVGAAFMDTSLYAGGDAIFDAALVGEASVYAELLPFSGRASEGTPESSAYGAMLPFTGRSHPSSNSSAALLPFVGMSADRSYASVGSALAPFEGHAEAGFMTPSYGLVFGSMVMFTGGSSGLTGEIGSVDSTMRAFDGVSADRPYASSVTAMEAFVGRSDEGEGAGGAVAVSLIFSSTPLDAPVELYVTMSSTGAVTSVFAVQAVVHGDALSTAAASTPFAIQAELNALLYSIANGGAVASGGESTAVWVVNADTTASTRYENYAFNSFGKIDGVYYGAKTDGIYRLDGDDDTGDPVQAMVSFGKQTFGTSAQKSVSNCYIGMSSGGKMFLKVLYEGKDYIYSARTSSDDMKVQRFDLGKGIKANYLEFELYNADGDDFELDTVEFLVAELSRRI
jgi:hypothetical protein